MAFIDRTVAKRLLIERLVAQLALDSAASGVDFVLAGAPDPPAESDTKWCRILKFTLKRRRRHRSPDPAAAERVLGADLADFVLIVGVVSRVSAVEESDYAWDSAAAFVERAFYGAEMIDPNPPTPPATAPVHVVSVHEVEALQDTADDEQLTLGTGIVTVSGIVTRLSGDSLETRPA